MRSQMQDKFGISPWEQNNFFSQIPPLKANCGNQSHIVEFFTHRISRTLNTRNIILDKSLDSSKRSSRWVLGQKNGSMNKVVSKIAQKENSLKLDIIKSTKILKTKGGNSNRLEERLKKRQILNLKQYNLQMKNEENNENEFNRDSQKIILDRFIKLKQSGRLNFKEGVGHRILRF